MVILDLIYIFQSPLTFTPAIPLIGPSILPRLFFALILNPNQEFFFLLAYLKDKWKKNISSKNPKN